MREGWRTATLGDCFLRSQERLGTADEPAPVFSLLKEGVFRPAETVFSGRVAARDLSNYKVVRPGRWAYSTIHIDEGSIARFSDSPLGVISPMYTTLEWREDAPAIPRFLELLLRSPHMLREYRTRAAGSINRRRSLPFERFAAVAVQLPPLDEQRRIVDLIGSLDAAIAAADDAVAKAEQAHRSVVTDLLKANWTDEFLRALPEAVEILDAQRRPVNAAERARRPGVVPYYGATGRAGWIDAALFDEDLVLLGEDAIDFLNPKADKAYAITGPSWVNNHAHVLRPREGHVLQTFIVEALNRVEYSPFVGFGTRSKLTQRAMRQIAIPVPPLADQRRVAGIANTFRAEHAALLTVAARARDTRAALLSDLLSGEHEIPASYDRLLEAA
jgi:type I restriction enzyme S subunit